VKIFRIIALLIGLSAVGFFVHQVGVSQVASTLGLLRWSYFIVLAYPLVWMLLNTMGWQVTCPSGVSFLRLVQIRMAGECFNSLLPSGYVGGEPLKVKLLAEKTGLREATASALVAKSAQSIGMVLYLGLGLTYARPEGSTRDWASLTALTALGLGIGIFTWLLANRSFSRLGRVLHRLTGHPWLHKQEGRLLMLDESLGHFFRHDTGRFFESVVFHTGGWLAGALELWIIFHLLGHPFGWKDAWFMGAMAQLGATVGFVAPAGVGFFEGGHYLAAIALGLPPSLGVSVSLIRRVREIFWDIVGVSLFWKLTRRQQ
jgi:hypothetical protein